MVESREKKQRTPMNRELVEANEHEHGIVAKRRTDGAGLFVRTGPRRGGSILPCNYGESVGCFLPYNGTGVRECVCELAQCCRAVSRESERDLVADSASRVVQLAEQGRNNEIWFEGRVTEHLRGGSSGKGISAVQILEKHRNQRAGVWAQLCNGGPGPRVGYTLGVRKDSRNRRNRGGPDVRKCKKCLRAFFGRIALCSSLKIVNSWCRCCAQGPEGQCDLPPVWEPWFGKKSFYRSAVDYRLGQFSSFYQQSQLPARGFIIHPFKEEGNCVGADLFDRWSCFGPLLICRDLIGWRPAENLDPVRKGMALSGRLACGDDSEEQSRRQSCAAKDEQHSPAFSHMRIIA